MKRNKALADLESELDGFERSYAKALSVSPPLPVFNLPSKSDEERCDELRKRIRSLLARRFIESEEGRNVYVTSGLHAIVGRYKAAGAILDYDHALRTAMSKIDAKTRLKMLRYLAKQIGLSTGG